MHLHNYYFTKTTTSQLLILQLLTLTQLTHTEPLEIRLTLISMVFQILGKSNRYQDQLFHQLHLKGHRHSNLNVLLKALQKPAEFYHAPTKTEPFKTPN